MFMKKKLLFGLVILLVFVLSAGIYYIHLLTPIITGYAAKNLASNVFVGNRTQESVEAIDLNFSFIKFTHNTIDYKKKEVTSRFLWAKSKAIYIEGFGCTLVRGGDETTIRNRPYTIVQLPSFNPDSTAWPMGDKLTDSIISGIDLKKINALVDKSLRDTIGNKGTFAVAVAYKNQLIVERYRSGFSQRNRFLSWSMAKSITNALVGIMVKNGTMYVNEKPDIPAWRNDKRSAITLENLLHMNSGLKWNEDYGNLSNVTVMLHEAYDMAHFSYGKSGIVRPDSMWYYSSGTTNIVSYLIRKKLGNDSVYYAFPRKELFNPIGMRSAIFETDASGTFVGSSYIYATMRDYVRFGLLYMNKGNWLGKQILPLGWTEFSTKPAQGSKGKYGAFFWLNKSGDFTGVPRDAYMCKGHDGQVIFIIPSVQLVVVRTGFSKKDDFNFNKFIAEIVATIKK